MRYSCVQRAGPTLSIRRRSLCASGFLCMHKTVRGARRMNVHARRTPAMRRPRWTNAGHTRGTRGAHAGHALCVRRLWSSARIALRGHTPSVLLRCLHTAQHSMQHVVQHVASNVASNVMQQVAAFNTYRAVCKFVASNSQQFRTNPILLSVACNKFKY